MEGKIGYVLHYLYVFFVLVLLLFLIRVTESSRSVFNFFDHVPFSDD